MVKDTKPLVYKDISILQILVLDLCQYNFKNFQENLFSQLKKLFQILQSSNFQEETEEFNEASLILISNNFNTFTAQEETLLNKIHIKISSKLTNLVTDYENYKNFKKLNFEKRSVTQNLNLQNETSFSKLQNAIPLASAVSRRKSLTPNSLNSSQLETIFVANFEFLQQNKLFTAHYDKLYKIRKLLEPDYGDLNLILNDELVQNRKLGVRHSIDRLSVDFNATLPIGHKDPSPNARTSKLSSVYEMPISAAELTRPDSKNDSRYVNNFYFRHQKKVDEIFLLNFNSLLINKLEECFPKKLHFNKRENFIAYYNLLQKYHPCNEFRLIQDRYKNLIRDVKSFSRKNSDSVSSKYCSLM